MSTPPGVAAAWQGALAAEARASFGYGLLGPHLSGAQLTRAVGCSDAHDQLRDRTAAAVAAAGLTPVGPAADYPELYPVGSARAALALAVRLEDDCASAWRYLYLRAASSAGPQARAIRPGAQAALTASAVRAAGWRVTLDPAHASVPFPGVATG
jgi:hypothetical protein